MRMSVGLLALLDDIAGLVKLSAASLDDVAGQAAKAGVKAAGAVIDDAAVTPKYVDGIAAERELPIVGRIAFGSLRNKLLVLLPIALALSIFLPQAIALLLMIGGAYLCYEGAEKVFAALVPHAAAGHEERIEPAALAPESLEEERVAGAIKTDFILSAEIMTIALAAIPTGNLVAQAAALALAGAGITVLVYGGVALIVKADDFGVFIARNGRSGAGRGFGRWLVGFMPKFMAGLGVVGTAAMIWVGGGIILHGLDGFGFGWPEHLAEGLAHMAERALPFMAGLAGWAASALVSGIFGLLLGALLIPVAEHVIAPLWRAAKRLLPRRGAGA
jgi:predicted DNA repair protein MutK